MRVRWLREGCVSIHHNTLEACWSNPCDDRALACDDHLGCKQEALYDDRPFIVLTETKFSFRCIPVGIGTLLTGLGSKKKNTCDNVLTMTSTVPW